MTKPSKCRKSALVTFSNLLTSGRFQSLIKSKILSGFSIKASFFRISVGSEKNKEVLRLTNSSKSRVNDSTEVSENAFDFTNFCKSPLSRLDSTQRNDLRSFGLDKSTSIPNLNILKFTSELW